ncbi:MAG: Fic family protein [Desulfohalobiaceae bacterium]
MAAAAAYLYHLIQNHPFIDGNKRTGPPDNSQSGRNP